MLHLQKNIKKIRQLASMSQTEMGFQLGASKDQIAAWETGRSSPNNYYSSRIAAFASVAESDLHERELNDSEITIVTQKHIEHFVPKAYIDGFQEKYLNLLETVAIQNTATQIRQQEDQVMIEAYVKTIFQFQAQIRAKVEQRKLEDVRAEMHKVLDENVQDILARDKKKP